MATSQDVLHQTTFIYLDGLLFGRVTCAGRFETWQNLETKSKSALYPYVSIFSPMVS